MKVERRLLWDDYAIYADATVVRVHLGRERIVTTHRSHRLADAAKDYICVSLVKNGRRISYRLHRLVAQAFHVNPHDLPIVRHLDGDPRNNAASNLAWGTQADNIDDAIAHGTRRQSSRRQPTCLHGHPWTEETVRVHNGGWECVICKRIRMKAYGHPNRARRTTPAEAEAA